jgi:hypothetical protein
MLNFMPLPMIMSPGFWSTVQGPSHFATMVMVILSFGVPSLCELTTIV